MDVHVWGPDAWRVLEDFCAGTVQSEQRVAQAALIKAVVLLCPCPLCRPSAREFLKLIPLADVAAGKQPALPWIWRLHNWVNAKLGKPQLRYSKLQKRLQMRNLTDASESTKYDTMLRFLGSLGVNVYTFGHPVMTPLLHSLQVLCVRLRAPDVTQLLSLLKKKDKPGFYRCLAGMHRSIVTQESTVVDGRSLNQLYVRAGTRDEAYATGTIEPLFVR